MIHSFLGDVTQVILYKIERIMSSLPCTTISRLYWLRLPDSVARTVNSSSETKPRFSATIYSPDFVPHFIESTDGDFDVGSILQH